MSNGVWQMLKKNRRSFVMFLLGVVTGSSVFLILYGQKLDGLLSERNTIYYANNQKYKEILKLEKEIEQLTKKGNRRQDEEERIKKIVVEVDAEQPFISDAVKTRIEKKLSPFLDKSMQWISNNPDIIELILEKEQVTIDDTQRTKVEVHLKYVSLYDETLKIWLEAKSLTNDVANTNG
jgi:mannitol-specific phosphotransferase system IIBC component